MPDRKAGSDLELLTQAALAAGEVARGFFETGAKSWDKPGEQGPVTEADLAVNDLLHDRLTSARADYGWLSEETPDGSARLSKERLFIVDPIDGTRSFVDGARTWAHSLAVVENGVVTAGVVYLPMRDLLFRAETGGGAYLNDTALHVSHREDLHGANILATRPNMEARHWDGGTAPDFTRHHRPSLAYRLSLVAKGAFDAMMTLRPSWEWDIAAGALIASEAGARITDRTGAPLRFNNATPQLNGVLTAPPGLHASLLNRLAKA
ncbi:MAG: 3'(2'),5'-bisphosphate nucleotidase CysQ [Pseudomonadota bacterium]